MITFCKPHRQPGKTADRLTERIHTLKNAGFTVLLAEQNVKFTLGLSDYVYIIDNGRICHEGTVDRLMEDDAVRRLCGI